MAVITSRHRPAPGAGAERRAHLANQALWFTAMAALAFLTPYVLTSVIGMEGDWYYLCYFAISLAALGTYVVANDIDLVALFTRSWRLSLGIGAASTAFVVWNVLVREDATARPHGAYFVFELVWRGLAYGVVDALLLTAFPAAVAFAVLRGEISGIFGHAKFAGLALAMTLVITATYHLGYQQFRDDGVAAPETGNVIISLPTLASANPLGSVIAHAAMHGAAVSHAYETDVFLPPQESAK